MSDRVHNGVRPPTGANPQDRVQHHEPDAVPSEKSRSVGLQLAQGWRRRFVEITASRSWSPTGIVAYGRTPKKERAHGTNGLDARPAPKRMNFRKYKRILQGRIHTVKDLELAKELIVKVSPMGRAIFEAFDQFLEAEEEKGTPNPLDPFDGRFEFIFPGDGTYAARRGDQDRATSWGSAVSIETGQGVFALIHEIVHAMPLERLPAELLRIPYRSPDRERLSFEDRFVRHIESAYHDEAISGLAEIVLFDDLRRARAPLPKEGEDGYVDHVRAMSQTYAEEGLDAYLDSELYIGRNHRIDYNVRRLIQMAVLALAQPETLRDVTVSSVLAEGGITVTAPEGSPASKLLAQVNAAMDEPTPENIQALVVHAPRLLKYVTLDPQVMVQRITEFFEAYTKGKNPRRGRGFLGKRDVTVGGLRLLGKARAVYNDYIQESMRRSPATREGAGDPFAGITDEDRAIYAEYVPDDEAYPEEEHRRYIELTERAEKGDDDALRKLVSIRKVVDAKEKEAMEEAPPAAGRGRVDEEEMTAAGLTELEKRAMRIVASAEASSVEGVLYGDILKAGEQEAYNSGLAKLERYRVRQEQKEQAAAEAAEGEGGFDADVYERAKITDEEIALYEEFRRGNVTLDELGERYADGDERAGKMRDAVEKVFLERQMIEAEEEANAFEARYGDAIREAGLTGEETNLFRHHVLGEGTRRSVLYQRMVDGDAEAAKLLDIMSRVDGAKKRIEGEAPLPEAQFDFGDAPDALDALWNMTLDLAQEAGGKRRDELIARAQILHDKLTKTSMSEGAIGIPSHQDLDARYDYEDHETTPERINRLGDAWGLVRNLHAAVILRNEDGAAAALGTIGLLIAQVFTPSEDDDDLDPVRSVEAIGIEVPGIMASVGRVMRTASKVGLPLKQAYVKLLAPVAQAMFAFFRSWGFEDEEGEFTQVSEVIMDSPAFGARAQADYASFFFELLDNDGTEKLAEEWARFFVGSPLGLFFYRRLHASVDDVARRWKGDFKSNEARTGFGGYGFHPFFLPPSSRVYDDGEHSEQVDKWLLRHAGYGNYLRLIKLGTAVRHGSFETVRAILDDMSSGQNTRDTLTIPVRGLPIEPSRIEGALVYRGEGGAPRFDIALSREYAPLLKAWGQLIALPRFDADAKEKMLREVGRTLAEPPGRLGLGTLDAALKMHYAHMIAVHGSIHDADAEVLSYDDVFMRALSRGGYGDVLNQELAAERALASDMASLVKAKIALAAHDKGDHEEARRRVEYLHDYYTSIVRLRREGLYPDGMARAAEALSRHPAYRDIARKLLGLAVEHVAAFKNDEEIFPRSLEWLIRSIDGAALPYDMREELMGDLVRTVIPEVRATSGYSPQEMQLKAYHVSRVNDVIYERGLSVHLARYEAAEALLYNRTADLIDEYGGMATSDAMMRGRFLQAAMRVNRELTFTKPQLVAADNIATFERMDDGSSFQLDLADIFPEQLAAFDENAPVDQWNPTYVRRGLPDPEQSFARIAEALERDPSQGALDVYAAFVRWEVDRAAAAQPRNVEALENILAAYKRRIVERGEIASVEDVTSLDADDLKNVPRYAAGLGRMLSRRELMALRETLALPSVTFAFDRLGSVFGEQRDLSAADEGVILAALDARGPHEAQGKRELFLYTLFHDSATLALKRRAAYNLALSFSQEETIARLIDAYEKSGDGKAEARFYKRITGFWQLTGQLPSDYYLMLLDGAGNGTIDPIDRLEELMRSNGTEATTLDLELRYGWQRYYGRLIDDMQAYVDAGFRLVSSIVHRDQVVQYLDPLKNDLERARSLVRELKVRHLNRLEEIDVARANLPNIFLKQPPVVRFLLLSYFGELSGAERARLVQEMNELERAEGRAETFMHFFQMAGLEKLGQTLSTLVGIVPEADRAVFARLQDKVPAGSAIEVRETIEREQEAKIEDLYEEFDDTPIASASIAEVYRARLKGSGEEVYLKVIPGSKRRKIMETAARLRRVAAKFEEHSDRFAVGLDIAGMITWFADELEGQLNLRKEMRHAIQFGDRYDALTPEYRAASESVLMMLPLDGIKVTDLDASSPRRETAARRVGETGVKAVLAGYYHADPHPGNIFVNESSGDVSWLDFGTMGMLEAQQRIWLMDFLFTLAIDDAHAQRMALEAMGTPDAFYDGNALEAAIAELAGIEMTERAARIIALAGEHHLFVQHQCSQAITNLLTLKGVVAQLDPGFDFASVFTKLMPAAYAAARESVGGARSPAKKTAAREHERKRASVESLRPRQQPRSPEHARAAALYGLIDTHGDALEATMGEDAFADLDELADELVGRADREPDAPTVKRGLIQVEDTLRRHLSDAIVDAALGVTKKKKGGGSGSSSVPGAPSTPSSPVPPPQNSSFRGIDLSGPTFMNAPSPPPSAPIHMGGMNYMQPMMMPMTVQATPIVPFNPVFVR